MTTIDWKKKFHQPGHYLRFYDRNEGDHGEIKFIQLMEGEGILKYPWTYGNLTSDTMTDGTNEKNFDELDPADNHIYQIFLGVDPRIRATIWHPYDEKILKWDEADIEDIDENETANIQYTDSPYSNPQFELWILPEKYPNITIQRIGHTTVYMPRIIFLGFKYNYREEKDIDPVVLDKLRRNQITVTPISIGKI